MTPDRVDTRLATWLAANARTGEIRSIEPLAGGNSNATYRLWADCGRYIIRRPPQKALSTSAHAMDREYRVLGSLWGGPVPVPRPIALCDDPEVFGAAFLVMEEVDGVPITDRLPAGYPDGAVATLGEAMVDVLADLHGIDWRAAGLEGFGRPEGFLDRQVERWRRQYAQYAARDIPAFEAVAAWLSANQPPPQEPSILHGDFHLDNCLWAPAAPRLAAVIDWELATIGDPLLDLGLCLAMWGERPLDPPGMPRIQAVSRAPGSPDRRALAARYAQRSGRSVEHLTYYLVLALWKLAAIVEGAYAQHVAGQLSSDYARSLERDVPALLGEAAAHAGLRPV